MGSSVVQIEHDKEITKNQSFVRNMISWPIMAIRGSIRPTNMWWLGLVGIWQDRKGTLATSTCSTTTRGRGVETAMNTGSAIWHPIIIFFCVSSISLQLALLVNKSKFAKRSWTHIMSPLLNHVQVLERGSTHGNAWFTGTGKTGPIICWSCLWLMASITSIYCFMLCHNSLIHNSVVLWRSPPTTTVWWAGFRALT